MSLFKDIKPSFKKKKKSLWEKGLEKTSLFINNKPETKISKALTSKKTKTILSDAEKKARQIVFEAEEKSINQREKTEKYANHLQEKILAKETKVHEEQKKLALEEAIVETKKDYLDQLKKTVFGFNQSVEDLDQNYLEKLSQLSKLQEENVKSEIFESLEKRLRLNTIQSVQATESKVEEDSDSLIQNLLTTTMFKGANNYAADYNSPVIQVKHQRLLDNILGTNNCNKDFFEKLADVEMVVEDNNRIKINSQDSVKREIARQTLEKIIKQRGRINPARLRRIFSKTSQRAEIEMFKAGKDLCHDVGVFNLPKDIIQKLGKFKYRFSYGQNMIEHTLEETLIGIALAHELKVDSNVVRLGCLFHDIGKVIHDDEGTHVETGVAYLKEHNIPQAVIDCVAQSHEDEPFSSIESIIVHIADGISGARPAARHSDHEFTNRIKYLEATPLEYKGVRDAYAIQAGREVRVIVDPRIVDDKDMLSLAEDLRDRIKSEIAYPGSVTVNVIRETSTHIKVSAKAPTKA